MSPSTPDIDLTIAKKLLGLKLIFIKDKIKHKTKNGIKWVNPGTYISIKNQESFEDELYRIPPYSHSLEAAQVVIDKMFTKGFNLIIQTKRGFDRRDYPEFKVKFFSGEESTVKFTEDQILAQAICMAALNVI